MLIVKYDPVSHSIQFEKCVGFEILEILNFISDACCFSQLNFQILVGFYTAKMYLNIIAHRLEGNISKYVQMYKWQN